MEDGGKVVEQGETWSLIQSGKKRAATDIRKLNGSEKKTKVEGTPKPGQGPASAKKGAKGGPVTPTPAAKEVKTPKDKGQQEKAAKTPKGTPTAPPTTPSSDKKIGQYKCTGCDKMFITESALSQHAVAKHKK